MKQLTYITLFIFCISSAFAQRKHDPSQEDIAYAKSLKDIVSDQDDIVLDSGKTLITFNLNTKTSKVVVNEQIDEQLINIKSRSDIQKYCFYDGQSSIERFDFTFKNGKSAYFRGGDEAYTSNDLFHNDTRVKYFNLDFPSMGYKYGSSLEKVYKDIKYFTRINFIQEFPTKSKTVIVKVPNWLNVELKPYNFEGYDITLKSVKEDDFTIHTYTLKNLPSYYKDENAPGSSFIYPHVLILAKSFTYKNNKVQLFESTQDLYNWYRSLTNSLDNDNTAFKTFVADLIKDATTDKEKIKAIYYWVQDNIRYIAFEDGIAGFKPDEASNVYKKRYGDCKGMANLTKQMLTEVGFDARLTWIGTNHIAYDYSTPNLAVDNHMICTLVYNDDYIFLDATEKYNAFGEYATRIQNQQVLIENGDNYILKTVPKAKLDFNRTTKQYNFTISETDLVGDVEHLYEGENRAQLLYYIESISTDRKEDFLEYLLNQGNNNNIVSDISTTDLKNRENNITFNYNLKVKGAVSEFENTLYIEPNLNTSYQNYKMANRKVAYQFSSQDHKIETINIAIPDGYMVSYLPENISITHEKFEMTVSYSKDNNKVTYKKEFKILDPMILKEDFKIWDNFIKKLDTNYKEQITFTKS